MSAIPREERLLNLLSALLAARAPLPFNEIKDTVAGYDDRASGEALEKRFDRDKADLRKLGVPLEFVKEDDFGRSGYRIEKERFFLSEIRLGVEEGIVLAALHRAAAAEGGPLAASLRSALTKISVDSPLSEALRDSVAEQQLLDPRAGGGGEADPLTTLAEALGSRRPVRFSYYSLGSDRTKERKVEPYGIGYFGGHWYLVGRDVEKGDVRVFRTSRIKSAVKALRRRDAYEIPADFDLRHHLGRAPWNLRGEEPVSARIRFDPDVAWMIAENVREGQRFESAKDGSGTLTVTATDPPALVRWVAQYGPSAEILEPEGIREALVEHLTGLVARYGT